MTWGWTENTTPANIGLPRLGCNRKSTVISKSFTGGDHNLTPLMKVQVR